MSQPQPDRQFDRATAVAPDAAGLSFSVRLESTDTTSPLSDPEYRAGLRPIPSGPADPSTPWPASDIVGIGPDGAPVAVLIDQYPGLTLLAFLTSGCDGCEEFWRAFAGRALDDLAPSISSVVITKGPDSVDRHEIAELARGITQLPVVMSDRAWADYRVTGYPFFVLVDARSRSVIGETVGFGWSDVLSMVDVACP